MPNNEEYDLFSHRGSQCHIEKIKAEERHLRRLLPGLEKCLLVPCIVGLAVAPPRTRSSHLTPLTVARPN